MEVNRISFKSNTVYQNANSVPNKEDSNNTQIQSQVYSGEATQDSKAVNAALKANALSNVSMGYKEIQTFKVPFYDKGKVYQLDNGQKVIIIPKPGPMTLNTFVRVGSFNEPDRERGISHYIEHNLFNGSDNLKPGEFVQKVNEMGATYNAGTTNNETNYFIFSPIQNYDDFEKMMSMHSDMLQHPSFTEPQLEKERGPVISEIHMYEDRPENTISNKMLKNLFNIQSSSEDLVAGCEKNIKSLTKQDVMDYYNKWYTPDNMTTVVVGEVNPDQAIKTVAKYFNKRVDPQQDKQNKAGRLYENLNNPTQTPRRVDISTSLSNSASVGLMFVGPKNKDIKDTVALNALGEVLTAGSNSVLSKALDQYNTSAGASLQTMSSDYNAPQVFEVSTDFKPGDEENGLKTIYAALNEVAYKPISDKQLQIVKNNLKESFTNMSEHSMAIASCIGDSITNTGSIDAYSNALNMIDSLTAEDIMNAAKKYVDLNKVSIGVIHPESEVSAASSPSSIAPTITAKNATSTTALSFKGGSLIKQSNISEYNLPNNIHTVINEDPAAVKSIGNISFSLKDPMDVNPALPDVLSLMLDCSKYHTKEQLDEITELNDIGFVVDASQSGLSAGMVASDDKLPLAMDFAKEIMNNPDLSEANFEKSKEKLKLELLGSSKSAMDKGLEKLSEDRHVNYSNDAILKGLDSLTLKDVTDYYNYIRQSGKGMALITMPTSKSPQLKDQVLNNLQTDISASSPYTYEPQTKGKALDKNLVLTQADNRNQADIVQLYKIAETGNVKDKAALMLLNEVLGGNSSSKLFMDLRETQKLAYRTGSHYVGNGSNGFIALDIKTTTQGNPGDVTAKSYDNVQKSLEGFKKNVNDLITQPIDDKTLNAAKQSIKNAILEENETTSGRTAMLSGGYNSYYGAGYVDELMKSIDQITPQDIQKAANLYLNQPSITSIVASQEALDSNKDYLNSIGEIEAK